MIAIAPISEQAEVIDVVDDPTIADMEEPAIGIEPVNLYLFTLLSINDCSLFKFIALTEFLSF